MGSTTVQWKGRRFEATDAALAVWLELLISEIKAMKHAPAWLREAADDWHLQATAGFGFGVTPELDEFIIDDERRNIVLGISESALKRIDAWSDPVSAQMLNDFDVGGPGAYFYDDPPLEVFRRVGLNFVDLLRDDAAGQAP